MLAENTTKNNSLAYNANGEQYCQALVWICVSYLATYQAGYGPGQHKDRTSERSYSIYFLSAPYMKNKRKKVPDRLNRILIRDTTSAD